MNSIFSEGYFISLTSSYVKLYALQAIKDSGIMDITAEQYGILYMLSKEDGLYQRQFSKMLVKDRPNITRMLDILEKKEFLVRKKDVTNRRKIKVFITETGKILVDKVEPLKQEIIKEIARPLSNEEILTLLNLLEKVRNNLENKVRIQI